MQPDDGAPQKSKEKVGWEDLARCLQLKADKTEFDILKKDFENGKKESEEWFHRFKTSDIAVAGIVWAIFKLEFPSLFNLEIFTENVLRRLGVTRSEWGFLWKKGPDDLEKLKGRVNLIDPEINRFKREYPEGEHGRINNKFTALDERIRTGLTSTNSSITEVKEDINRRLTSTNVSITRLGERVSRLEAIRSRVQSVPQGQPANISNAGTFTETAAQINRLEDRITALVNAIGAES